MRQFLLTVGVLLIAAGCSDKSVGSNGCTSNSDCGGGEVCDAGTCVILCSSDLDCGDNEVCEDSLCVTGARQNPTIDGIDGDGTIVCPDAGGTHCISTGIIITGTNLAGAQFNLAPQAGGTSVQLFSRPESGDSLASLDLPVNVTAGTYVLTAVNQVGSADQALELLQGPPGPDLTANEMVSRINTASNTIALGVLPVGTTAGDVASGAHGHDAAAITSGVIDAARLPSLDFLPLTGGDVDDITVGGTDVCLADGTNCGFQQGMVVNTAMVQTRVQGLYTASNSGTGTKITPLDLVITPRKAGNRVILEWVVNGEGHHDTVFLVQRNGTMLPDSTNASGNRWAGVAARYDGNNESTPENVVVRIIDMNSLASQTTYSLHIRSSSNGTYNYRLNRAQNSAGQDAYEATLSNGTATEIWW